MESLPSLGRCSVLGLLLSMLSLSAADWPQWRGVARDGSVPAGDLVFSSLPIEAKVLWKLPSGPGLASPVVSEGRVFHFEESGGKESVQALAIDSGVTLWRAEVDQTFKDEQGPSGPRCTPLVDGDRLYLQSCRGRLMCLDVRDGHRIWNADFQKDFGAVLLGEDSKVPGAAEHGYTGSPLIIGSQLIACVGGTNGAGVVSFDKRTGNVLWKSQDDLASYAAPIVATLAGVEQIVCFTVEGVIGLSLTEGRLLWRIPLKTSYGRHVTTPVVVGNWVIVGSYTVGLVGIEVTAVGSTLHAEQRWVNKVAAMNFSSPVVIGDRVVGLGPARNLIAVEAQTGRIIWSRDGFWGGSSSAAFGAFTCCKNKLLVWTDAGQAILVEVSGTGCRELGRTQVCGKNWCSPALVGNLLFVRDGFVNAGSLYAVDLSIR